MSSIEKIGILAKLQTRKKWWKKIVSFLDQEKEIERQLLSMFTGEELFKNCCYILTLSMENDGHTNREKACTFEATTKSFTTDNPSIKEENSNKSKLENQKSSNVGDLVLNRLLSTFYDQPKIFMYVIAIYLCVRINGIRSRKEKDVLENDILYALSIIH